MYVDWSEFELISGEKVNVNKEIQLIQCNDQSREIKDDSFNGTTFMQSEKPAPTPTETLLL